MRTIKLVIIGDSGVGKTSIRGQYISGRFSTGYRATIGTDFITKTLPHYKNPEESVTLQIWDTAGQERFSSLSSAFFRGADAALLMFDVNKPDTLDGLHKWWGEFKARAPVPEEEAEDYCCVVVGNKIDMAGPGGEGERVSEAVAERFLEELIPRAGGELDDPFVTDEEDGHNGHANGMHIDLSSPVASEDALESESPTRTQSIHIRKRSSSHHKHTSKSRSSDRLHFGGTMTSTHTTRTIYHTPSSSLFDRYESAPSSPSASSFASPPATESAASPSSPANRHKRRMTSASSSSSAPTITPSLFMRSRASTAALTPPTPPENEGEDGDDRPRMSPQPERRPKLFLTSAKTGDGVAEVFEYIARRVAVRWEHEEAIEARTMHVRDGTVDTVRLSNPRSRQGMAGRLASKVTCCAI